MPVFWRGDVLDALYLHFVFVSAGSGLFIFLYSCIRIVVGFGVLFSEWNNVLLFDHNCVREDGGGR